MPMSSSISTKFYGKNDFLLVNDRLKNLFFTILQYKKTPGMDAIKNPGFTNYSFSSYIANAYEKTPILLTMLGKLYGKEKLNGALKNYYETYRFRHPKGEDLIQILSRELGGDSEIIIRQMVNSNGEVDYAITDIYNRIEPDKKSALTKPKKVKKEQPILYRSCVLIERKGEIVLPVEVLVVFEDRTEYLYNWNALQKREKIFEGWDDFKKINNKSVMAREGDNGKWLKLYSLDKSKIKAAYIDPGYKNEFDINLVNNSFAVEPDNKYKNGLVSKFYNLFYKNFLTLML
jgi:hypothetical protein